MDFVVVLHHVDRSGVQQIFGPYGTETLANKAMGELKGWPTLRGEWEVRPLTRHSDTTPPALPYAPPTLPVRPPQPYQDRIVWCDTSTTPTTAWTLTLTPEERARMTTGASAGTATFMLNRQPEQRPGGDGTAGVPARV